MVFYEGGAFEEEYETQLLTNINIITPTGAVIQHLYTHEHKHMHRGCLSLSPDTAAWLANNMLIQLLNNQCLCSRRWGRVTALEQGVKPPRAPRLWQWETQLMLFIDSAWQAHSRKWLVKSYLFGEAEAAWMKLCSCQGRRWMELLGWAEQRQVHSQQDKKAYSETIWSLRALLSGLKAARHPLLLSAHPYNKIKKRLNFPAVSTLQEMSNIFEGPVWIRKVRELKQHLVPMSCATLHLFVVVVYRRDLIKLGQVKAGRRKLVPGWKCCFSRIFLFFRVKYLVLNNHMWHKSSYSVNRCINSSLWGLWAALKYNYTLVRKLYT